MALAIFFATSSRSVARLMLKAMSGMRAPMTMAPAVGCGRAGPKSGAQSGDAIFAASPSNSPRLMSSRLRRAGVEAASS